MKLFKQVGFALVLTSCMGSSVYALGFGGKKKAARAEEEVQAG